MLESLEAQHLVGVEVVVEGVDLEQEDLEGRVLEVQQVEEVLEEVVDLAVEEGLQVGQAQAQDFPLVDHLHSPDNHHLEEVLDCPHC